MTISKMLCLITLAVVAVFHTIDTKVNADCKESNVTKHMQESIGENGHIVTELTIICYPIKSEFLYNKRISNGVPSTTAKFHRGPSFQIDKYESYHNQSD